MKLALLTKLLRSSWRSTSMRFYCLSMILAVAAMTSVGIFSDRISLSIEQQAVSAVGGDIQLSSHQPIPNQFIDTAKAYDLTLTHTTETQTVLFNDDALTMVRLKVVANTYPLQGRLELKDAKGRAFSSAQGPTPGQVWLDGRILDLLNLKIGDTVEIGELSLPITAELVTMPDNGTDLFALSPVAMINDQDLAATELVLPGSRAKHHLMAVGERSAEYLDAIRADLGEAIRVLLPDANQSRLFRISNQGLLFLRLGALCALLMASVAIGLTTHLHVQHEAAAVAIFRTLGMRLGSVIALFSFFFLVIATTCTLLGMGIGIALQSVLGYWMAKVSPIVLSAPSIWPFVYGLITSWVLVLGLTLPALLRYQAVSTKSLLSEQTPRLPINAGLTLLFGLSAIYAVMALLMQNLAVANLFLLALAMLLAGLAVVLLLAVFVLSKLQHLVGINLRLSISQLARRLNSSLPQLLASALAIGLLITLSLLGSRLLALWGDQLPKGTPNYFAYNVSPDETAAVNQFFSEQGINNSSIYPLIRGRVSAINDRSVQEIYQNRPRPNSLRRALNLTYAADLPDNNKILAGRWFTEADYGQAVISIEQGMAARLGVGIGDALRFNIGAQQLTAKIISIRSLEWTSFKPNFFVIFPPGVLNRFPSTGVVSFYLPEAKQPQSVAFSQRFPTVTILDIGDILERIQSVIGQLQKAIGALQLLTLATTCLVLILIVMATLRERLKEIAVLKTCGASSKQLRNQWLGEMALLGVVAGGLAASLATFLEYQLSVKILNLEYSFDPTLLVIGILLGLLLHLVVGFWGLKRVIATPAASLFRNG